MRASNLLSAPAKSNWKLSLSTELISVSGDVFNTSLQNCSCTVELGSL